MRTTCIEMRGDGAPGVVVDAPRANSTTNVPASSSFIACIVFDNVGHFRPSGTLRN
jgi:hypothetical protein